MPDSILEEIFRSRTPSQAMVRLAERELLSLPTSMSSADLQQLSRDIRAGSLFSARTTNANYLEEVANVTRKMLSGEINIATGRAQLQDKLKELDYNPERGFPGDEPVPPAEAGSLRDLSSNKRLKLVLETQTSQAQAFAQREAGMDESERFQFPAWELVRFEARVKERDDWDERFVRAGGSLVDGRMIALKDDPVWSSLGDSGLFDDGLDSDFPPYAYSSGMAWRAVGRDEAVELGVVSEDYLPERTEARFFDEGDLDLSKYSDADIDRLLEGLRPAA